MQPLIFQRNTRTLNHRRDRRINTRGVFWLTYTLLILATLILLLA